MSAVNATHHRMTATDGELRVRGLGWCYSHKAWCGAVDGRPPMETQTAPEPNRCVYIAGPMTNIPRHNFPAFDRARDAMAKWGWEVISPADLSRANGVHEDTYTDTPPIEDIRRFARQDIDAIFTCAAIYMLAGWEKSTGARAEHAVALWLGLRVFYQDSQFI